jgi:hypothetical protein
LDQNYATTSTATANGIARVVIGTTTTATEYHIREF